MPRIYALDAMNTGQAAVTWLSTVGTGLISAVICSRMAFRQRGGEKAWTAAVDFSEPHGSSRIETTDRLGRRAIAGSAPNLISC